MICVNTRMKIRDEGLTILCPVCAAMPGKRCELNTGQPRNESHKDRRIAAEEELGELAGRL
jgi:hypothetical protein